MYQYCKKNIVRDALLKEAIITEFFKERSIIQESGQVALMDGLLQLINNFALAKLRFMLLFSLETFLF